jgi:putative oxidoreductase
VDVQAYGLTVLRLAVGAVFVGHGTQKLFGASGGGGLSATAASFAQLGFNPPYLLAAVVSLLELAGGILLVAGALTAFVSLVLLIEMAVATWKMHLPNGFFMNWGLTPGQGHGYEFNLVLMAALACFALSGPGALSLDGRRARSAEAEAAGRARLRGGKV